MPPLTDTQAADKLVANYHTLRAELAKRIVGQEDVIEQVFIAWPPAGTACSKACPASRRRSS